MTIFLRRNQASGLMRITGGIKSSSKKGKADSTHITEMVGNFAAHLTRDEMAYGAQERGLNWGSIRAPDELVDEGHLNDRGF